MKKQKEVEDQLFEIGLVLLIITIIGYFIYQWLLKDKITVHPCLVSLFLGFYCPGCGGTRAVNALFHGKLLQSLWYHPVVPYSAVILTGFMGSHALNRMGVKRIKGWKFHDWYLYAALGIIAVNFVVKNILRIGFGIFM